MSSSSDHTQSDRFNTDSMPSATTAMRSVVPEPYMSDFPYICSSNTVFLSALSISTLTPMLCTSFRNPSAVESRSSIASSAIFPTIFALEIMRPSFR